MSEFKAITYVGKSPGFLARVNSNVYDFEWRKSLGIGSRQGEVRPDDARALAQYRDRRGKKLFILEKPVL